MPKAKVKDIELYYEVQGPEGAEPLVLISGLGHSSKFWFPQVPEFSKYFKTIIFDNRGVGESDKPDEPYSIAGMAADAAGLLGHLGVEKSHVLGASMGGYIAQEIAISYPERVKKLVLLCTHYGGPEYLELTGDLWKEILDIAGLSPEEIYRKGVKYSTTPEFFEKNRELVEKLVQMRLENLQPAYAFQRQFAAAAAFSAKERLHKVQAQTLVLHGREDRIVPPELAKRLTEAIRHAKLKIIDNAAHLLFIERPEEVNRAIIRFLEE